MFSIRGLQKTTLIDYPGKIACIIFFSSCNFRCPFCHNKDLVLESKNLPKFPEKEILKFLKSRVSVLEGVVLTGGEPLLYPNLDHFIKKIKELDFLVKLDTNGELFSCLKKIVESELVDYVALDFKMPLEKYEKAVGVKVNKKVVLETMRFLISGKVDYEFRTTVVPGVHREADLIKMAEEIQVTMRQCNKTRASSLLSNPEVSGSEIETMKMNWFLQQFRPGRCLDPEFNKIKPYPKSFYDKILPKLRKIVPNTYLRGA